ncbi:unnamed protein product [Coregonus sp. 'balchen']|nr:unnamed protein product [Coregonus sp. 'balchen']
MGSSMGCVRPPREGGHGLPPLSPNPKRRLRFRRKRKGKKHQKRESVGSEVESIRISNIPEEEDEEEEDRGTVTEATTASFNTMSDVGAKITNLTVPHVQTQSRLPLPSALCADSTSDSMGGLGGSRVLSPEPSPVWRRVSYPGAGSEEGGTSSTIEAPSSQGQPSEDPTPSADNPDPSFPSQVYTTPGGGRVCKVREREQGVLERPCILRPKKEREREKKREKEDEGGGGLAGTLGVAFNAPSEKERKGVVHIREVEGRLCVVRTVYPSDFGSPVWRGDSYHDKEVEVEVRAEPPAASPVTGKILKVQLSEEDIMKAKIDASSPHKTAKRLGTRETTEVKEGTVTGNKVQLSEEDRRRAKMDARTTFLMGTQETTKVKELSLDKPAQVQQGLLIQNPLSSGYANDLPLTSPETGGVTQVSRVGLTQSRAKMDTSGPNMTTNLMGTQETTTAEGPSVQDPLSSGYASDLPLTSPEAGGATQVDWESSREGLDSATDSPLSPPQFPTKQFPQISEIYVSGESGDLTAKEKLLLWSQQATEGWPGLRYVDVPSPDEKSVITYEVDHRWAEYQSRFSTLLQWSRQHTALMANKNFPLNPVELKALYNEYVHFKETEIPAKEMEKSRIEHLYKLLEGLHPNDLEEEWGKLILEMLEREKALRPAVERLELLLQMANKIQNMALDCEEKLTLAKNTLQADMSQVESGEAVRCERELGVYLQDCEALIRQLNLDLHILRDEKYYQVEQLAFRVSCLNEELVSLRLQCSSIYRKGHFSPVMGGDRTAPRGSDSGFSLSTGAQTLLGAVGVMGSALLRRPMSRSQLVAMSSSEDEGSLRFIYELLGWVEETQDILERAEWGADLPSVEQNLQDHHNIHTAAEDLLHSLKEARNYQENSSWRLRCLESLHAFVCRCTEELIWLNEREEEELAYDWSHNNTNVNAKKELYAEMRSELEEKQEVMHSLQETADRLCQENHPAKQTVEAYSAALQTQWQWVRQLCVCVEQHLKDNTAYFQFVSDARDCETYLRQLQDTIKRQYTCDKNSRLGKLEDLLQDSMITISRGEECVLEDNSQRTKWKVISPSGNEAMVPSVCFTVPPPNQEAMDTAGSVVSWHYLQKDIRTVSSWSLDTPPVERDQALDHLEAHLADFLSDSKESATLPPGNLSGNRVDNTVQIAEHEKLQSDLDGLRTSLGEVSRRCVSFFEEKPTSSSVPVLRSELNLAVEKIDRLHNLSSVHLHKLKTVDVLMHSLQAAESQVKRYESRLSEEDIVPADTNAIQALQEQLGKWQLELEDQEGVFSSLRSEVQKAREAGTQLNRLHPERSPELVHYQERATQLTERWAGVKRQMDTRRAELEALGSVLQQYRDGHSALIHWIEETTERQENTQPGKTDSKVLSEQLAQQTALVAEIEKNQTKLDECQTHSKHYTYPCVHQDYELQLMTFRAFVESTQKSTVKRRRMHSSSDAITQEFMDMRTRYTALVTLTTQHVKYISDALRRLEEEEKEVEEERQQRVSQVSELLGWVKGLQGPSAESSITAQQAVSEQLAAKKEEVAKAIRNTQVFLMSKQANKLSPEERAQVTSQLDELTATYSQLCDRSSAQLQQLEQEQAKEEQRKSQAAIGGVIDLGTMETVPVFQAAQRGLIDQDTCHVLLEAQLTMGGLFQPVSPVSLSLEEGLNCGLIDSHISQSLSELESALHLVDQTEQLEGQLLPVAAAMEEGLIREELGLRILELQMNTGGLRELGGRRLTLDSAGEMGLLTPRVYTKLRSRVNRRELVDPNTAEKLNLSELQQRCVLSDETGLHLLPVKQQPGGTVCLPSGRKVGIFRAVQESLIDRQVTVRLLEAQLFAGGITDPRSGRRLTVDEAVRHNLMDLDLACAMLTRQLQSGGILDPVSGERLGVEEAIQRDLLSPRLALLVLESLWAFMGLLWPESGELLPIAEALQQGVISGELARNILRQRHTIGALYLPEIPKVVSLNQAKEVLEPKVAEILKEIQIPDVLHNMNQSGSPKLNRLSWGSTGSSPPSSPPASSPGLTCDPSFLEEMAPEEQAHHRLLFHLMTHSYMDSHSGQRLVLLEPELVELVKAATGLINVDPIPVVVEAGLSLTSERQEFMEVVPIIRLVDNQQTREIGEVQERSAIFSLSEIDISSRKMLEEADSQGWDGTSDMILQAKQTGINEMGQVGLESTMRISEEVDGGVHREVKGEKDEIVVFESVQPTAGLPEKQFITDSYEEGLVEIESEGARDRGHKKTKDKDSLMEDIDSRLVEASEMYSAPLKTEAETLMPTQSFKEPAIPPSETNEKESVPVSVGVKHTMKAAQRVTVKTQPQVMSLEAGAVKSEEEVELERLASELLQGGLLTEGRQRLLPDEAVAQGVLPGHTAVKLMAKAGLFGGFLDVSACESLSTEDVMQEGLLDEDLMWSVLKSEKTLAGVVDVEKGKICTLKDAAQAGLIDSNTAARLLEAQVVSGGVVDLLRDKKVSVTLAANLGLIEEDQREKLVALEKSYRGKCSDPDAALTKAMLQLQMDGVVDPKTKSPVPLKQALERGLLGQEEVYQALSQQVAEGGIVHHNSGVRLSVADALQRGLIDRALAPELRELERACQGEVALSSNPDAALLQASTGAILDPDLKCRLTLTEAVSDGLLDESTAKKAMVSPGITQGVLDPQSAQIVPYSDLVNQGKIDIKSGKRFLEVNPFKGIQDKQTGEILNLAKAIASQQVDPVPALRMLQSQADSGGIIDISDGARLPLPKASKKGLVGEHMARLIASNQVLKGGLLDPSTGQRVSSLKKAVKDGLISREMAAELQDNLSSMEVECDDEDSSTPVASSNGTYSPAVTLSISSPDSQTKIIIESSEVISPSPHPEESEKGYNPLMITEDIAKTLEAGTYKQSEDLQHRGSVHIEEEMEDEQVSIAGKSFEIESDQSINLLAQFAINAEKRLHQALQEMETPQDVTVRPPENDNKKESRSVCESSSVMQQGQSAMGKEPRMDSTWAIGREGGDQEGSIDMSTLVERDEGKTNVVERDTKIEVTESDDLGHASPPSKEVVGKSKKKRKNKTKGKGKEVDIEQRPSEKADILKMENKDQNAQSDGKDKGVESTRGYVTPQEKEESLVQDVQSAIKGAKAQTVERFGDPEDIGKVREGSTVPPGAMEDALEVERDGTEYKVFEDQCWVEKNKTSKILIASEKVDPVTEERSSIHDSVSIHNRVSKDEQKREGAQIVEKSETDGVETVSQQTGQQEHKDRKEVEFTLKTTPASNDKEALLRKAKESILRKVFGRGVSEKQAADELEALRQGVGKKESLVTSVEEVKTVGSPEVLPEEREGKGIDKKEEGEREKVLPDHSMIPVAAEEVEKAQPYQAKEGAKEEKALPDQAKKGEKGEKALPGQAKKGEKGEKALPDQAKEGEKGEKALPDQAKKGEKGEKALPDQAKKGEKGEKALPDQAKKGEKGEKALPDQAKKGEKGEKALPGQAKKGEKEEKALPDQAKKGEKGEKALPDQAKKGEKEEKALPDQAKKGEKGEKALPGQAKKGEKEEKALPDQAKKGEKGEKALPGQAKKGEKGEKALPDQAKKGEKGEKALPDQAKKGEKGEKALLDQIEEGKNKARSQTDQLKEMMPGNKNKKNKKSKMHKVLEKVEPATEEKPSIHNRADSEVKSTPADLESSVSGDEQKIEKQQDNQPDSDVTTVASGDEMNKMAASTKSPSGVDTNQQRSTHTTAPYQINAHLEEKTEDISLGRETDPHGKDIEQFRIGTPEKDVHPDTHCIIDIVDASPEALVSMSGAHLVKASVAPCTQTAKPTEETDAHLVKDTEEDRSLSKQTDPLGKDIEQLIISIPEEASVAPDTQPAKTTGKGKKKKQQQEQQQQEQKRDSPTETECKEEQYLEDSTESGQSWSDETPQSDEIVESDTTEVPESDTTESWEEGEIQELEIRKEKSPAKTGKSSLLRQEFLEHDQQIVALLSMVRHIEVRLKQQQQQSIGRSLIALDDIIKQTETLDLELRDLESQVKKEVDAAGQLLEPRPQEVPPQLLLALEKDGRSLARGYETARGVSENILQGLCAHREAHKEAVTGEQKSLGGRVEDLLFWLKETEAQITGMDGQTQSETPSQCTQQLRLCKVTTLTLHCSHFTCTLFLCTFNCPIIDLVRIQPTLCLISSYSSDHSLLSISLPQELQSSLSARSNDVNALAFDIQVFISERAQDLAPEQSRQLLGQLQQLQRSFHRAAGQAHAKTDALAAQREREEERQRRHKEKEEEEKERESERRSAREREVVQQQKAECSQKLEGLTMWLAGAASVLANQRAGAESGDVNVLQQKQRELKEVQKDLQTRGEGVAETVRSVEEFLAEHGDSLSPEDRANLQGALSRMKEEYSALTDTAHSSLAQLDTAICTTVQQNTQRAKALEELLETRVQMDSLLEELSSLNQPGKRGAGMTVTDHLSSSSSTSPEGGLQSHSDMLQAELQQLQAQQAQLMQVSQNARSLLVQPDSAVPAEEKRRLRDQLDQLQTQHQEKLQACQERLRRSEALKDELAKFLQEHRGLGTWLEHSEGELCSLGEGETDAQGLKGRLEEHKKLAEDVICHKADLRFVSISGQKVLDSVQGALEKVGGSDPALEETKQLVTDKLQDANHRYTTLHTKSSDLGGRLSALLERCQQYQDEAVSLHTWLSTQEQNQSIVGPSGETDTLTLQNTLRAVQLLQDELAERSVQLEKVRRSSRELANTQESPTLRAAEIISTADGLEKRFNSLSKSVSERAEQLQTSVAQSVSVQEGLKGLLAWLDGLLLTPGPIQPTAQAVQDALTQNQKLRQELLSRQGSVEATCDSVSKLLQSSDASTASGLQGSLESLTQRYAAAQAKQAEKEAELRGLLPKLESYERLNTDLQSFTQTSLRALSPAGQPDRSVEDYRQTIEEVRAEQEQEAGQLKSFCQLGTDLSQAKSLTSTQTLLDNVREVSDEFARLESNITEMNNAIQSCEQRLGQFRSLSGSLLRWLQTAQEQLPPKEPNLNTEALQRRVQQLKDLLSDWEAQGTRVQELNKTGSELETLIINITAPQTKTGVPQINGAGSPSSVNGIHTCKDLTELQVAVAEVNGRYEELGGELKNRQRHQEASLELRQKASQGTEELSRWLRDRENSLHLGQTTTSPSKPELVRAQAQENKALLSELAEHSGKVEELKSTLEKLIADNPDSPEADTWRQQMKEIDSRWAKANETAVQRQTELETCADRLGCFATAASQLGPWLREKELMMSVLGPLSIDPNMLNTQKQQVQFMLREFETRRPQFDQLTQAAEGILSPSGGDSSPQDDKDLAEVRSDLASISQQWDDLTQRLSQRSEHIDQAQGTSERYQALLKDLSVSVGALGERLDGQASLSAQPEALKRRLQETGEIRTELEQRREELGKAEKLCGELSAIVIEPYLRDELKKRLESVSGPLRSLEERAADGLSQLQAALSSTQQFQQMFEELRSWLDNQGGQRDSTVDSLPCQPEALQTLLAQQDELHRGVASQRGPYELIQAEGASLLASLPAGAEEQSALQSRLTTLRQDWDELNQCIAERQNRLKTALTKAESYQQHRAELTPWVAECEKREADIQPSLDPAALDEALQKARQLGLDLERRRPLLEGLNTAADQLLEHCRVGEEDIRDEKAQLNRRVDGLAEKLQNCVSQLEELAGRLKEFEDGRQAVERRLEAARHQIEVQEALGPQACSNKSLERLRSQQETLHSLQPQVAYLRDLAQGLVQDAPQTAGGGGQGGQRLEQQARDTDREFGDVSEKIEQCCSTLESRLKGVGEVQSSVRDLFSRLADLDDELDSLSPVRRDADSLASQADAVRTFLAHLATLRSELEGHGGDCTAMLRREGSSPDLLALRRETEALSRQAGKLAERGQARLGQIEAAAEKVGEFYAQVAELQGLLGRAEEGLNAQGVVGTERMENVHF